MARVVLTAQANGIENIALDKVVRLGSVHIGLKLVGLLRILYCEDFLDFFGLFTSGLFLAPNFYYQKPD